MARFPLETCLICRGQSCTCHANVQHRATSCNFVQHRATSCNFVQHRATSCNIVQHRATEAHQDMIAWPCSSTVDVSQEDIRAGLQRAEEKSVENGDLIYSFMIVFNERRLS